MKIPQGILGGGRGKVGPVVASIWRGLSYVKAHQPDVANPRTEGQVRQRAIMSIVGDVMKAANQDVITPYLRPFRNSGETEQNLFSRNNLNALRGLTWDVGEGPTTAEALPVYLPSLLFSHGSLETVSVSSASYVAGTGVCTVSWDATITGNGLATDKIIVVIVKKAESADLFVGQSNFIVDPCVVWTNDSEVRSAASADVSLYADLTVTDLHAYVFSYREGDPNLMSNTINEAVTLFSE